MAVLPVCPFASRKYFNIMFGNTILAIDKALDRRPWYTATSVLKTLFASMITARKTVVLELLPLTCDEVQLDLDTSA